MLLCCQVLVPSEHSRSHRWPERRPISWQRVPLSRPHRASIDTDRVVGFPQHATIPTWARPGGPSGRSDPVAPTITTEPQSETVVAGATASFSAAATGTPTPTVQWEESTHAGSRWSSIRGATATTYNFTATSSENGDEFEAVFRNSAGSATTTPATLTVGAATPVSPTITSEPTSESVTAGTTASFSAAATGTPTPTVQWWESTNGGSSFSTVMGATATTYNFTATSSENGDEFEAVFRNSAGSATTTPATLTVGTATPVSPTITSEPTSESVTAGTTASFSAAATGTPTPTVQWWESTNGGSSFSTVMGATSTTYSFTATSSENGDEFYAVFTNSAGSAKTNTATLTVTAALVQSSNWSGYAGLEATFDAVSAFWTVPTLTCSGATSSYSAQWTGIDGYSSDTVEQDGTEADCIDGSPSYDAWYEMYGDSAVDSGYEVELNPATGYYPVSPGDTITVSVTVSGSSWTLSLADATHWTYSTTIFFSGAAESSAEWVVERPEICSFRCSLTSLADFGSVTFSNASASVGSVSAPISAYANTGIEMVNGITPLAVPGALNSSGNGFTDTWQAS